MGKRRETPTQVRVVTGPDVPACSTLRLRHYSAPSRAGKGKRQNSFDAFF